MSFVKHVVGKVPRFLRGRPARLLGVTGMVTAVVLGFVVSLGSASAAHRSPCENGVAVGRICHYVYIVSEGADYDAEMEMQTLDGYPYPGVGKWHESNPSFTRWFWDYDQARTSVDFKLHLRITVRNSNWGLDTTIAGDRDTCFQISRATSKVFEVQCPEGGGIG